MITIGWRSGDSPGGRPSSPTGIRAASGESQVSLRRVHGPSAEAVTDDEIGRTRTPSVNPRANHRQGHGLQRSMGTADPHTTRAFCATYRF